MSTIIIVIAIAINIIIQYKRAAKIATLEKAINAKRSIIAPIVNGHDLAQWCSDLKRNDKYITLMALSEQSIIDDLYAASPEDAPKFHHQLHGLLRFVDSINDSIETEKQNAIQRSSKNNSRS